MNRFFGFVGNSKAQNTADRYFPLLFSGVRGNRGAAVTTPVISRASAGGGGGSGSGADTGVVRAVADLAMACSMSVIRNGESPVGSGAEAAGMDAEGLAAAGAA